jgi:hypothetical protein
MSATTTSSRSPNSAAMSLRVSEAMIVSPLAAR